MRVFVTPCDTSDMSWDHDCLSIKRVAALADRQVHDLVPSANEAEIVIVTDLRRDDPFGRLVRENSVVTRYPEKTFVCCRTDRPIGLLPGVYASPPRDRFGLGRYRTGFYLSAVSEWRNPFVSAKAHEQVDKDLLFSFVGRNSSPVRTRLFAHDFGRPDIVVTNVSSSYNRWDRTSPDTTTTNVGLSTSRSDRGSSSAHGAGGRRASACSR